MKQAYYLALKQWKDEEPVTWLEHGLQGRPLLLGNLDKNVQEYLRISGGIVNQAILIVAATGIEQQKNPAMLHENGSPVELGKKWADSILLRMGLVKRKATKAARKIPPTYDNIKLAFLQRS